MATTIYPVVGRPETLAQQAKLDGIPEDRTRFIHAALAGTIYARLPADHDGPVLPLGGEKTIETRKEFEAKFSEAVL
jgi:hypothetical protein